jgi:hypothetical protein
MSSVNEISIRWNITVLQVSLEFFLNSFPCHVERISYVIPLHVLYILFMES